jgi:hypothetical protein
LIGIFIVPVSFYVVEWLRGEKREPATEPPVAEPEPPAVAGARGA